ncbi:MAG: hypothetical protein Q4C87_08040 [Actinomycetaceae bacterium]|nr:hypothetical protein [Actinomycetaceae bacterium]
MATAERDDNELSLTKEELELLWANLKDLPDEDVVSAMDLNDQAYEAFCAGYLERAAALFAELHQKLPTYPPYPYMQGMAEKYRRNWQACLDASLTSLKIRPDGDEASAWNAAIAATALGKWDIARRIWDELDVEVPGDEGEIRGDFGYILLLLNCWGKRESVYARRIDPVRAEILSIPFPESGYRRGDIILTDGGYVGHTHVGDRQFPVMIGLECLQVSDLMTLRVLAVCPEPEDAELLQVDLSCCGEVEDLTGSAPCASENCPWSDGDWHPGRTFAVAAPDIQSVKEAAYGWQNVAMQREVIDVYAADLAPLSSPKPGADNDPTPLWWEVS